MAVTTWRIRATPGHGWVQHLDAEGRVAITADPWGAHQWPSRQAVEAALARTRSGLVPMRVVEGPAFELEEHGRPG